MSKPIYAMAFIDGQNLYQHAKAAFGHHHPNFDPIKLHNMVCAQRGWTPNLVRFYTGIPSREESEMWAGYWSNRILAMQRSGILVTTRPLQYRSEKTFDCQGQEIDIKIPQEKGIDVRLALDVVVCAIKGQYDVGVIYSQDQDLNEVVIDVKDIANRLGKQIDLACAFPSGPNASYRRGIDKTEWIRIEQADYDQCVDPKDYRPKR